MIRDISRFTAVFIACALLLLAGGLAPAQKALTPVPAINTAVGDALVGDPLAAQPTSAPADDELKLVVALFRHGVRSLSPDFVQNEDEHSKDKWPPLNDWKVLGTDCDKGNGWGYLTIQGQKIAQGLGKYYGNHYKQGAWSGGFKVYFWADAENQRTRETAKALAQGFVDAGVPAKDVTTASLKPCTVDLLFHPFKAKCGTPDTSDTGLAGIANSINKYWPNWTRKYKARFDQLFGTLGCGDAAGCNFKTADNASSWSGGERKSPITWKGRFSFASGASEAFLLEYANNMSVGWDNVDTAALHTMLPLHDFFFDQTERRRYLATVQGSNLLKEIFNVINRKATNKPFGCPHAPPESQFIGLVGHDTNLAHVGSRLGLRWKFDDPRLPDDTKGLPDNDALPAGALVFELRQRDGRWFVRVEYVTQSLSQMRNGPISDAFRLRVRSPDCLQPSDYCEMSLDAFNKRVNNTIGKDNKFLSSCDGSTQKCSERAHRPMPKRRRIR